MNLCAAGTVPAGTKIEVKCGMAGYNNGSTTVQVGCSSAPACPTGYTSVFTSDEMTGVDSYTSSVVYFSRNFINTCKKD